MYGKCQKIVTDALYSKTYLIYSLPCLREANVLTVEELYIWTINKSMDLFWEKAKYCCPGSVQSHKMHMEVSLVEQKIWFT